MPRLNLYSPYQAVYQDNDPIVDGIAHLAAALYEAPIRRAMLEDQRSERSRRADLDERQMALQEQQIGMRAARGGGGRTSGASGARIDQWMNQQLTEAEVTQEEPLTDPTGEPVIDKISGKPKTKKIKVRQPLPSEQARRNLAAAGYGWVHAGDRVIGDREIGSEAATARLNQELEAERAAQVQGQQAEREAQTQGWINRNLPRPSETAVRQPQADVPTVTPPAQPAMPQSTQQTARTAQPVQPVPFDLTATLPQLEAAWAQGGDAALITLLRGVNLRPEQAAAIKAWRDAKSPKKTKAVFSRSAGIASGKAGL